MARGELPSTLDTKLALDLIPGPLQRRMVVVVVVDTSARSGLNRSGPAESSHSARTRHRRSTCSEVGANGEVGTVHRPDFAEVLTTGPGDVRYHP